MAALLASCGEPVDPPDPISGDVAFVSPRGDDAAAGTREAPFRTVKRGLTAGFEHLILLAGFHPDGFVVDRSARIEGEGVVVIEGAVTVGADAVVLKRLWVDGGIRARSADDLRIETTTVTGGAMHTIEIDAASVDLLGVTLECAVETCLFAARSVVDAAGVRALGAPETKRVLRFDGGQAHVEGALITGGTIASVLVEGASVVLSDSDLRSGSNGLVALVSSVLSADGVRIADTEEAALLLQGTTAEILGGHYMTNGDLAVGVTGGSAHFSSVSIGSARLASVSVSASAGIPAAVRIDGGRIDHATRAGVLVTSSKVRVEGTLFIGEEGVDGDDAITASGAETEVTVMRATFEHPSGFGVGFYNGAFGTVSATVSRPRLGGVIVEGSTTSAPVRITDTRIESCEIGSGVSLRDAGGTMIERVRIEGCAEGGVVALAADASVRGSALVNNGQFGVGAFDGAVVSVGGSTITGSPLATFATCGDGARVELLGDNLISGGTTDCP